MTPEESRDRRRGRVERWPWVWALIVSVLLVALGAAVIGVTGYTKGNHASNKAQATADCLNKALAARDRLTGELHAADVAKVEGQKVAEQSKLAGVKVIVTAKTRLDAHRGLVIFQTGEAAFTSALDTYIATSNRIRAEQLKHPLGAC